MTRFPFAPLESLLRGNVSEMARVLEVAPKQLYRWRRYGLEAEHAERCALALGRTPWELWPDEWFEAATKPCEARGCDVRFAPRQRNQRWCSPRCAKRERVRRRYHRDPGFAAKENARCRVYYGECADTLRAQQRGRWSKKKTRDVKDATATSTENKKRSKVVVQESECIDYKDVIRHDNGYYVKPKGAQSQHKAIADQPKRARAARKGVPAREDNGRMDEQEHAA